VTLECLIKRKNEPTDKNIWIGNCQSQGQTNWLTCHATTRRHIPRDRYNYIRSCLFLVLKSKQLRISVYLLAGVVCPFNKICTEPNEDVLSWWSKNPPRPREPRAFYGGLIDGPYIYINGSNSVWLSACIYINEPVQVLRLALRVYPSWQWHFLEPGVLVQICWHNPLFSSHSFISNNKQ